VALNKSTNYKLKINNNNNNNNNNNINIFTRYLFRAQAKGGRDEELVKDWLPTVWVKVGGCENGI